MYIPSSFLISDTAELLSFIRKHTFGCLVTALGDELHATHLPFMAEGGADTSAKLVSHFARANPQARHLTSGCDALVIFTGPHAYISPKWYENTDSVPTWNYTAVHVYGKLKVFSEEAEVRQALDCLVQKYEGAEEDAWRINWKNPDTANLLKAIVAFEIEITRIEGKYKLSQNRSVVDRASVAHALGQSPDPANRAVSSLMRF